MIPRVVFDCMVFLQATARPTGPAAAALEAVERKRAKLVVSQHLLLELQDVINRPVVRKKFKTLTDANVENLFRRLNETAVLIEPVPEVFQYARDPKDERYINLALAANAKLLVSRDNDLLDLMDDDAFRNAYRTLTILDPVAFLQALPNDPTPTN